MQINLSFSTEDNTAEVRSLLAALLAHVDSRAVSPGTPNVDQGTPNVSLGSPVSPKSDQSRTRRSGRPAKDDLTSAYNDIARREGAPAVATVELPAATAADIAETVEAEDTAETTEAPSSGDEDMTPTECEAAEQKAAEGAALSSDEMRAVIKAKLVAHGIPWAMKHLDLPKNPGTISSWPDDRVLSAYTKAVAYEG